LVNFPWWLVSKSKKRAVSEIITIVFLIAMTIIGGTVIMLFFQSSGVTEFTSEIIDRGPGKSLILTGYDSRDGSDLFSITTLDNELDQKLCTSSCQANSNKIPKNSGTEFLVLKVRNVGSDSIYLENLLVNEVVHSWDSTTGGITLDASSDSSAGDYPLAGGFSIIPETNVSLVQQTTTEIKTDQEVRLVIKLSDDIDPDITLNKPIRIIADAGGFEPAKFILVGGNVR
jgi:hypothetical protein